MTDLASHIAALPKAELHIHIEGSLEPELAFALARRNGVSLGYGSVEALRAAYSFTRLQDFLDLYYRCMAVLRTADDFRDLAAAYLERAHRQNIRHVELFFDPQAHLPRGVPFGAILDGLSAALADAARRHGISGSLILCFLRHLDEADAERTLDLALSERARIVGVGLDSSEVGHPPSKFARVFARARAAGFRLVAHAGEEGPPDYVWQAIDLLGVERIDHGIRAMEDPALVRRLAQDRTPLTVCPLSNLRLRVVPDLARHPLARMIEAGLMVTLNSDDPAYFGGYLDENYRASAAALNLSPATLADIARNGFQAAFLDPAAKAAAIASVDRAAGA